MQITTNTVFKQSESKNHILFVDSLRALAAIYVVINHAVAQYYNSSINNLLANHANQLSGIKKISILLFSQAHYAVDLFIVLSGFSLMLSVIKNNYNLKGGFLLFFKRRIIRIVPPYYFAMLFSLILIWLFIGNKTGTHWDVCLPVTKYDIITHILMIHDFFVSSSSHINHVFWSIAVEFRIYLFFPLLVFLWRKKGAFTTLIITAIISVIGQLLLVLVHHFYADIDLRMPGVSPYIILFTLGMLSADIAFSQNKTPVAIRGFYLRYSALKTGATVIAYLLIMAFIRYIFKTNNPDENVVLIKDETIDVLVGGLAGLLLFSCSVYNPDNKKSWILAFLTCRPLVFIGSFSYSLYLIHGPILQMITQYLLAPLNTANYTKCVLLILGGTPFIIGIAYLFFWAFERPFLNLGKRAKNIKNIEFAAAENPAP